MRSTATAGRASRVLTLAGGAAVLAAGLALGGCVPGAGPSPTGSITALPSRSATTTPTPSPSSSPSPPPSATPSPSPSPDLPVGSGSPAGLDCSALITPDQMYDYNPNFTARLDASTQFPQAALLGQYSATQCVWANDSNDTPIDLGVALLDDDALAYVRATQLTQGSPSSAFGGEGSFGVAGGEGVAQAISGSYWIVLGSPVFAADGDAAALMADVRAAIG